jgi:DNA-binding FadR family transcriptional regulator
VITAQQRELELLDHKIPTANVVAKRANLHTVVANVLGEEIVSGVLPVGELLPREAELGARFNVSRTVVREAVKQLTSKGLLQTSSGIGTWVPPAHEWNFLDPVVFSWVKASGNAKNLIQHLFSFRNAIEPAAAAEAARKATDEQLALMKSALDIMCAPDVDFQSWVSSDVEFHTAIYIGSNNVFMASLASLFREYFQMSFSVSSSNVHYAHCLQEHIDVYDAIAGRRPDEALKAVQILLTNANEDVRQVMAE